MTVRGAHRLGQSALAAFALAAAPDRCELATDSSSGRLTIVIGTVEQSAVNGCWRLRADDGTSYELRAEQAPAALLQNGARVRAELIIREDLASVCDAGTPADVERLFDASARRGGSSTAFASSVVSRRKRLYSAA